MTSPIYDGFSVGGKPGYDRYSSGQLLIEPRVDVLDLIASIGQRQATWEWRLYNGVTGENLGEIYPLDDSPATITHDTSRVIKRDLRIQVDATDLAEINTLTDRIVPFMLIGGIAWPLGWYMFTGDVELVRTGGDDGNLMLMDEMNLIDQEITQGFWSTSACDVAMRDLLVGLNLPRGIEMDPSPYLAAGAWRIGSKRGNILATLAGLGDLETPWMDNNGVFRAVQVVDPATAIPDLSFDDGYPVITDTISRSNDLLSAPNRFVVVGNGSAAVTTELVGVYDIPPSAPHSIANRGFVIQQTDDMQLTTQSQATAAARNIGLSSTPVEQYDLTTPPDPRHDGYQVIRWRGENWLETAWSMTCIEGGDMTHTLRRGYL